MTLEIGASQSGYLEFHVYLLERQPPSGLFMGLASPGAEELMRVTRLYAPHAHLEIESVTVSERKNPRTCQS